MAMTAHVHPESVFLKSQTVLAIGASAVFASWLIWYGWICFLDVPLQDDWNYIAALEQFLSNHNLQYFIRFHNGQPVVFTRIAYLLDYQLFDLDHSILRWATMVFHTALATVILTAIASDLNQAVGRGKASWPSHLLWPFVIIVVSANLFSLVTWNVFNVASNLGWDVANLFGTAAIFTFASYLRANTWWKLLAVIVFGILASISFPHGFLVWPVLAIMIVVAFVARWSEH